MASIFQNPGRVRADRDVYMTELRLADLAEPLGFQSIWGVEHHFTDYTMCPDVLQFLSYMAGAPPARRSARWWWCCPGTIRCGSPRKCPCSTPCPTAASSWARPRAGKVEFDGFRLSMDESRPRFVETARMLLEGLERGYCEYDGEFVRQPRADIRPAPFKSFRGRTYAAAVSPESARIMAELGVGILIIPQKPWSEVAKELEAYRGIYREVNGAEAPAPISAGWTFCDSSADRAREMAYRYIGGYFHSVLAHYHFEGDHLGRTKGYEYYGKMAEKITTYGTDKVVDFFVDLQVWGTPEQCYDKIMDIRRRVGNDHYVGVFSYAGMPPDEAERNMRLFAAEVMPALSRVGEEAPALSHTA
jgi:alkanesulfonate monooxygenase SsuD/methylene tetrahydromethanopterin reductase-like flavin-dependent oxidoreductase (luciferase family)